MRLNRSRVPLSPIFTMISGLKWRVGFQTAREHMEHKVGKTGCLDMD